MTTNDIALTTLSFNGVTIRDRDEMLSLTDMWRAQGADPAQQPANWLASQEARRFLSVFAEIHNPGNSGVIAKKGKNGGTYAHWQIGLAYAKYLSPEFHMWCNTVVRERMEHPLKSQHMSLPPEVLEMIRRDDGISRMLAHKVTEHGKALTVMSETLNALAAVVKPNVPGMVIRYGKTAGTILRAAGFTNIPTRLALWFGNRLEAAGCRVEGSIDTGTSHSRLFDPDKAEAYLRNGGKAAVEMKIAERRGQGALALRGGALTTRELLREADGLPDGRAIVQTPGFIHFIDVNAYELDGSTEAAVIGADGFVRIDKPSLYDGHKFMGERSGIAAGKRFNMQESVVILGKVVESRAIRARPVLAIDNAGA